MRKVTIIGICLLVGVLAGLTLRPDDGTQVEVRPVEVGAVVTGMTGAKPLPETPDAAVLLRAVVAVVAAMAALVAAEPAHRRTRTTVDADPARVRWARGTEPHRGPPVFA